MGITISRTLTRGIALPVGVALVMGVGASGAHAAPDDPVPPPAAAVAFAHTALGSSPLVLPSVPPGVTTQDDPRLATAMARLDGLPAQAGPADIAAALFPDDEALRTGAVARLEHIQASLTAAGVVQPPKEEMRTQAVPAFVFAALPIIARCAAGSLGGSTLEVIKSLVRSGNWAAAEDLAFEAVAGCVLAFVNWPWLARRITHEIVGAVLWIIIHLKP